MLEGILNFVQNLMNFFCFGENDLSSFQFLI